MKSRLTLEQVMRENFLEMAGELRVCLPARIETYDPDTHLASVQPLLMRAFYGYRQAQLLPIINRVPIVHPRTASALIRLPVAQGDLVTLIFSDRSLEAWIKGDGGAVDPNDARQHHLSDAFAILGGYPEGASFPAANPDALEIIVADGTKITIGNGTDEVLQLAHDAFTSLKTLCERLSETLTQIQVMTMTGVTTGPGVSGIPVNAALFLAQQTLVDSLTAEVDATITQLENLKT